MNFRSEHDITSEILTLKKKIYVQSSQLQSFLQYLDQSVFKRGFSFCGPEKVQETPQFMRAFNTFTSLEKADYYLCCLKIVQQLLKKQQTGSTVCEQKARFEIMYRFNNSKEWSSSPIVINSEEKTVYFEALDKTIRLQNYLIRYSKCKDRNAFVLQSCTSKGMIDTIRISQGSYIIFQDLQTKIKNQLVDCLRQKLLNLMQAKKRPKEMVMKSMLKSRESISVEISRSSQRKSLRELVQQSTANLNFTIEDYRAISGTLVDQNTIAGMDNFSCYEESTKDVFINIEKNRVRKVYYFNSEEYSKEWVIDQLSRYQNFKIWKSSLFMISLLASIPAEKTQIFHEINMYKDGTECDYVYLRHFFTEGGKAYYIDRSISTVEYGSYETSNSRGHIDYCIWRISESAKNGNIQVMVECEISHIHSEDIYDIICEQIGDFDKISFCHPTKAKEMLDNSMPFNNNELEAISFDDNREFTSYEGVSVGPDKESEFYSIYSNENKLDAGGCEEVEIWQIEDKPVQRQSLSKKYRYKLVPEDTVIKEYKAMKNHRFFDDAECKVNDSGDLVFVNEEKIKAQSSVLKSVLKKIGTNLFTGKSILNVSLPIQIFSPDTNLERLCKGIAYAPLFLENKMSASPIEKMKAVIAFSVGNILLYIEMAKPFNPILGQTFQGFVDGCPIYGQQIAHHPPISSLFMVGRGYFVHANLQAKVEFGLNNASGINEGLYKIAFHPSDPNQNIISFFSPPGELSGVVLGQRKLTLKNKTRYFDANSQLFCEISWGKNKSHKEGNYNDYMEGKIVRLHKYQEDIHKVKVGKEDEILAVIAGRWTQSIKCDSQVIFDVNGMAPFRVVEDMKPLESDGKFRRDRMLVAARKLEEAQAAKEELQELQRTDRKLRKQKGK